MAMYNMVFHVNQGLVHFAVDLLNSVQEINVGRLRDAWLEKQGDDLHIHLYTRNGGGNREDYDDGSMQLHPWFIRTKDDSFDSTYASYWFKIDPEHEAIEGVHIKDVHSSYFSEPVDTGLRWEKALNSLSSTSSKEKA